MKLPRWLVLSGLVCSTVVAGAIERLPLEDFTREPDTARARLSPDGKYLAFLREASGRSKLHVLEIDTDHIVRIDAGGAALANGAAKEISNFEWVSSDRLIVTTTLWDAFYGVVAANRDGRMIQPISGLEDGKVVTSAASRIFAREMIYRFDDKDRNILMLDRHEVGPGSSARPDVMKVSTLDGTISVEVKNPGNVTGWSMDNQGVVRLGILAKDDLNGAIYRESEKDPWRTILPLGERRIRPIGFDRSSNRVLIGGLTKERRWTMFPLDPNTGEMGEPLLSDPEYDILPERFSPKINGISLCAPLFGRGGAALVGVRYVADAPRVKWFDPVYAGYQAAVDRTLPDTVNVLVDQSNDGKRLLWFGYSDQNPGVYLLLDLEKRTIKPLARCMGWIKPAQMAPMRAVKYTARDGLVIHGFLTVPVGHEPKNLPLVVMPHGGPWVRDIWRYEVLIQLLANRGYAVLQMNYRGSPGYGEELVRSARRQIGKKIQDDIEDATRWAIAAGVADPKRIALCGSSYGGFSALFALGQNPDMYRCGISIAGVSDWSEIYDNRKSDPAYKAANRHWRREIADPEKDADFLREISPVNFAGKITAPVFIIQGKDDHVVPREQGTLMVESLEKVGRKPRSLFVPRLGHSMGDAKQRAEIFTGIIAFLEQHLGPGVD